MGEPQPGIGAPDTQATIFLVLAVDAGDAAAARARQVCGGLAGVVRAIGQRDPAAKLSCVTSFGAAVWPRLFAGDPPAELRTFLPLAAGHRVAPSTPGDVLLHICAERTDLCFELASTLVSQLGEAVSVVDEVHGFRYFDDRDLIGFVDGTENPQGMEAVAATIVGDEDRAFAGGSYVIVQKYLHDLGRWAGLPVEEQERIIGRKKLEDIELDDAVKPTFAHNALTKLVVDGVEQKIVRRNMPFGMAGPGESGTFFIAYARSPQPTERMLENMFIGRPPGNYDRLLDFTHPVTGCNFFAPPVELLDGLATEDVEPATASTASPSTEATPARTFAGSLRIGSLKGAP
jgi:putative iron-dependent peroxidase